MKSAGHGFVASGRMENPRSAAELWCQRKWEKEKIMPKMIPYEKLSKKERRNIDASRRGGWGAINPVTRKPESSRAYNRRKAQIWKKEPDLRFGFLRSRAMAPFSFSFCGSLPSGVCGGGDA